MADINIIRTSLSGVAEYLRGSGGIFIVYDRNVEDHAGKVAAGFPCNSRIKGMLPIEATEETKELATVLEIDRWLLNRNADREALVLGIGGGIATDLVGFAASIYKRGVRFAFLPTTLLAQVDAAIGGKNGVNLDSFKNMLGVVRQPEATFLCPEVLETLPFRQFLGGAAEMLKTFLIDDSGGNYEKAVALLGNIHSSASPSLSAPSFSSVPVGALLTDAGTRSVLGELIHAAARIKAGIAGRDPDEHGERRLLNLGHTFAHAIEHLAHSGRPVVRPASAETDRDPGDALSHGEAVAVGILLAARLADALKAGPDKALKPSAPAPHLPSAGSALAPRLEADWKATGLPTGCPYPLAALSEAMSKDKKASGSLIRFVLPLAIGRVGIRDLTPADAIALLNPSEAL